MSSNSSEDIDDILGEAEQVAASSEDNVEANMSAKAASGIKGVPRISDKGQVRDILQFLPGRQAINRARFVPHNSNKVKTPSPTDLEYHSLNAERKREHIAKDTVVRVVQERKDSIALLEALKVEVAREAASLEFQRIEHEKVGKDTSNTSTRRIDALKKMADIEFNIRKLGAETLDVRSEKFQKVFAFWLEILRAVVEDVLEPEQVDVFFNRLSSALEDWEDKASELIH